MNTSSGQQSRPAMRSFGVRAAALAGLAVAVGVPVTTGTGTSTGTAEIVIAGEHPDPSTCCGRDPDPT